jgi:hypothetical protein
LTGDVLTTLNATDEEGNTLSIDGVAMKNSGLRELDLVKRINTDNYFKFYDKVDGIKTNILSVFEDLLNSKEEAENKFKNYTNPLSPLYTEELEGYSVAGLNYGYQISGLI